MRFIIKKGAKQFLLVYMMLRITIKTFLFFFQQSIRIMERAQILKTKT